MNKPIEHPKPFAVTFKNDFGLLTYIVAAESKEHALKRAVSMDLCETFSRVTCSPVFNEFEPIVNNSLTIKVQL